MSDDKYETIYKVMIDGAYEGLEGEELFAAVIQRCPKTSEKQLLNASILALSHAEMTDPDVLRAIYKLAAARQVYVQAENSVKWLNDKQ